MSFSVWRGKPVPRHALGCNDPDCLGCRPEVEAAKALDSMFPVKAPEPMHWLDFEYAKQGWIRSPLATKVPYGYLTIIKYWWLIPGR